MLECLHIRNYRVFNDLKIDQLSRINLIAGKNNSGKTSLLEAIFLLSGGGNAQSASNANILRIDTFSLNEMASEISETFWKPLFSKLDMNRPIEITGHHKSLGQLVLKIVSEQLYPTELSLDRASGASATNLSAERSLTFQYTDPTGQTITGHNSRFGTRQEQPPSVPFSSTILLSQITSIHQVNAVQLGVLRKQKKGHLLLEALQVIEPRLQSIEDNSSSGVPMIWGDIGLPELVPLSAMGGGMTRIARLVLAISATPNGVVLADEIENGLHHSVLPKVWQVVDTAAKQFNTQVFATTHSFECIEAAHDALGADGFLLHRLEASGTENRCVTYESEAISAAMRHYMEVR